MISCVQIKCYQTLTFKLEPSPVSGIVPVFHRNRMIIMIYAGITIAGFVSPWIAGRLIGTRGVPGYDYALLANAVVVIAGISNTRTHALPGERRHLVRRIAALSGVLLDVRC